MLQTGVAVDIGTTTVVVSLIGHRGTQGDGSSVHFNTLNDSSALFSEEVHRRTVPLCCNRTVPLCCNRTVPLCHPVSAINAQRFCGADVITRIKYCTKKGHEKLTKMIREQVALLMEQAISEYVGTNAPGRPHEIKIKKITIAGNTIMQHIAAGYSPVGMGTVPFTTISLFGVETEVWDELKPLVQDDAKIYYTPAISAYVGGDVTAGILAVENRINDVDPYLLIDIGTNGELALKHEGKYYTCATAAGPAFEGAHIKKGMAAVNGAINYVTWDNVGVAPLRVLKLSVIGDTTPKGICGSGLIDILAYLLETGKVDETGKLDGKQFNLTDDVYITYEDIRKLQVAKAAIAAGVKTLLHHVDITEKDIGALILAGNFGNYINIKSAARVGLFDAGLLPVTKALGNTALDGAALTLMLENAHEKLEDIRNRCRYIELSTSKVFNDEFIEQMMF